LRVRALVCVRWPRTGRLRRWRSPAVALNFDQPADVHLDLLAEIPFHAALGFDRLAEPVNFFLGKVLDLFREFHVRLGAQRRARGCPIP
jgi:hypothetical protein